MNKTLLSTIVFWAAMINASAVQEGASREQVIAELGKPRGEATVRGKAQLFYPGGVIELTGGKVTHIDADFVENAKAVADQAAFEAAQKARGLVNREGVWVTREEAAARETAARENAAREARKAAASRTAPVAAGNDRVREVRDGGQTLDLAACLQPGKVTVVDFFADWCGPCRQLSPTLEAIAAHDADVYLRKVDIVGWSSPVARQFGLSSIPQVRVYNRSGQMVGSPTHNPAEILKRIEQAKR